MNTIKKLISGMMFACGLCAFATAEETIPWCAPDTVTKVAVAGNGGLYIYTYNDRGNELAVEYIEFDRNGTQTPQQKITSTYNRFDLVDTSISYVWRNGAYVATARKISSYDNQGNHIFLLNENSDGMGGWTPYNRYSYSYNNHNLKTGALVETPVRGSDLWENSEMAQYTYDAKDREISYQYYVWYESDWFPVRSTLNKYENDLLVEESGKGLNGEGYFKDTYHLFYTYNAQGKPAEWLYLAFNDSANAWDSAYMRKFGYYADGSDSMYISYTWNLYYTKIWDSTVKELYTNYPDGQRHTVKHYTTEGADPGEWFLSAEMEYFYNEAGRRTSYIYSDNRSEDGGVFRYDFELNENNDDVRATCVKKQGDDWIPVNRYNLEVQYHDGTSILYSNDPPMCEMRVHYKSGTKTPVANETNQAWQREPDFSVRVWPNPAREMLSVEAEENGYFDMALYDLSGRKLDSRRAVQHAEFNVSEYHGVYLLRVERNGMVVARKVVIL